MYKTSPGTPVARRKDCIDDMLRKYVEADAEPADTEPAAAEPAAAEPYRLIEGTSTGFAACGLPRTQTQRGLQAIDAPLKLQNIKTSTRPRIDALVDTATHKAIHGTKIVALRLPTRDDAEYAMVNCMQKLSRLGALDISACKVYAQRKTGTHIAVAMKNVIPPIALNNDCHIVLSWR